MSRPVPKPSGRGVQCLKATSRLIRKALATRSTGTPASCSREARAGRKGLISSPERPRAFIVSTRLADDQSEPGHPGGLVGKRLLSIGRAHLLVRRDQPDL